MPDYYDEGRSILIDDLTNIVADNNEPEQIAEAVYNYLVDIGLIDYDVEKDLFYELVNPEEDVNATD